MSRDKHLTSSEIVKCDKCGFYYEFYYDKNDTCVAQTSCNCPKTKLGYKPFDRAIIKLKELQNEESSRSNGQFPVKTKTDK